MNMSQVLKMLVFTMDLTKYSVKRACIWTVFIVIFCIFGRVFLYLYAEFISNSHVYRYDVLPPKCPSPSNDIPRVIHQVMFNTSIPKPYMDARENCKRVNSDFVSILWNKTMVDELVRSQYPFLKELFYGYDIWVKRADVARYLIIHHHGGIYIDMDSNCTGR